MRRPTDANVELWHGNLQFPEWNSLLGLLGEQERRRASVYAFERDARRYVVGRALLRLLLGRLIGTPPHEVGLRTEAGGKPVLDTDSSCLHFSLARAEELVLIGFAARPIGVDLEYLGQPLDLESLAPHVLSPREREGLSQIHVEARPKAFLSHWTRKEAYLKAIGAGLSLPPDTVEVISDSRHRAGPQLISHTGRAGAKWYVDTIDPYPGYIAAVAFPARRWKIRNLAAGALLASHLL